MAAKATPSSYALHRLRCQKPLAFRNHCIRFSAPTINCIFQQLCSRAGHVKCKLTRLKSTCHFLLTQITCFGWYTLFLLEGDKLNLIYQTQNTKPTLHIEVKPLRLNNVYEGEGHTASMEESDRWWVQWNLAQTSQTSKSKDDKPKSGSRTL